MLIAIKNLEVGIKILAFIFKMLIVLLYKRKHLIATILTSFRFLYMEICGFKFR